MTHDLLKNLLVGLEAMVRKVVVTELRDDTFFAVIWLDRGGRDHQHRFSAVGRAGAWRCAWTARSLSKTTS